MDTLSYCEFWDIDDILDYAVKDISQKIAGLTIFDLPTGLTEKGETYSLVIHTRGDYRMTIALCACSSFFLKMSQRMKRSEVTVTEEEMAAYAREYFNVLCGRIVSGINTRKHMSARFSIPEFIKGTHTSGSDNFREVFYDSSYGTMRLEISFRN